MCGPRSARPFASARVMLGLARSHWLGHAATPHRPPSRPSMVASQRQRSSLPGASVDIFVRSASRTVPEMGLRSGRRADLVALGVDGTLVIVEIKSSVSDFRADQKWRDYRLHCDRLYFATVADVPAAIFPDDAGLIVADAYGAALIREAPEHRLPPATRRMVTVRFRPAGCAPPACALRPGDQGARPLIVPRRIDPSRVMGGRPLPQRADARYNGGSATGR